MNVGRFYFDTCILLDIYEKRGLNGISALELMKKIILEDSILAYSDMIVKEMKGVGYSFKEIKSILGIVSSSNLLRVHIYKSQVEEAKRLSSQRGVPSADALHAILSRDNHLLLVSRDKDFNKLKDITNVSLPEEFI